MRNSHEEVEPLSAGLSKSDQRRASVFRACNTVAKAGQKPSLRNVKVHHQGGSDTDIQQDVNAWYSLVFAEHERRLRIPDVPDRICEATEALWRLAVEQSAALFREDREALQKEATQATSEAERVRTLYEQTQALNEQLKSNAEKSDIEKAQLVERLAKAEQTIESVRSAAASESRGQDARISALESERAATSSQHEGQLRAQREDFEAQVKALSENAEARAKLLERASERAESHYRELEARLLQDVDGLRTQLKNSETANKRLLGELTTAREELAGSVARAHTQAKNDAAAMDQLKQDLKEAHSALERERDNAAAKIEELRDQLSEARHESNRPPAKPRRTATRKSGSAKKGAD